LEKCLRQVSVVDQNQQRAPAGVVCLLSQRDDRLNHGRVFVLPLEVQDPRGTRLSVAVELLQPDHRAAVTVTSTESTSDDADDEHIVWVAAPGGLGPLRQVYGPAA
jgi:hypothetical protein